LACGSALHDAFDVARQVTDGGVELGNGDTQHGLVSRLVFRVVVTLDAGHDFILGGIDAFPAIDLDPLARLEILVVLEEVGNLLAQQFRCIFVLLTSL
jgi:hypothetical protein